MQIRDQRGLRPLRENVGRSVVPQQDIYKTQLPRFAVKPHAPNATRQRSSSAAVDGARTRAISGAVSSPLATRRAQRPSRCASAPPLVASELLVNEKTFVTPTPPQAMAVSRHLVWLSYADGGCEVRNARTAEVVRRFAGSNPAADASPGTTAAGLEGSLAVAAGPLGRAGNAKAANVVIHSMLSLITRSGEPQVWLGLSNGTIEVHHGETTELVATLKKHLSGVQALAEFGGLVYSGGVDQQVVQWRAEGCRYVRAFMGALGHEGPILCMHAEGNALVTGAADDTVKVWDVGSGDMQLTGYFHARAGGVTALCRVGQIMWSGDNAGQLVRWTLRTCEAVDIASPHRGRITALKRAGSRVYSGSADGSVGVFCAETGRLLKRVEDQAQGWLTSIVCPAELSRFVVWSADSHGRVQCWYQDEYTFMTRDHEQLDEEAWYRSGSTAYAEFRLSLAQRNAQLREQLRLAENRDARTMEILRRCSTVLGGGATADVEAQYARLKDQMRMVEDRKARVSQDLRKKKEEAEQADRDLAATLALIQSTQGDLNTLSLGYGDRLAAALPAIPSTTEPPDTATPGTAATSGNAPGVTLTGLPGSIAAAPTSASTVPGTAPTTATTAAPGSLPTNPMLPPQPLTVPAATTTAPPPSTTPYTLGAPVAPLQPLGSATTGSSTIPGVVPVSGVGTNAPSSSAAPPLGIPSVPAVGLPSAGAAPLTGTTTTTTSNAYGIPTVTTTTVAPAAPAPTAGVPGATVGAAPLSHEQQVLALLASVGRQPVATSGATDADVHGVKWVNPNVGNYIQRRYYGASPSLRTPAIEKRERQKARMPIVKVVPLTRSASKAKASAEGEKK